MLRIAICDDLKSERDMVKGFLRSFFAAVPYEYTLAEYSRGETMVDDYDDGSVDFDLIFMDIQMPVMNGYEATKAIRRSSHELAKKIPIIAMTANVFAEDIQKVLSVGMNDHVAKPVDMNILVPTMMKYL